MNEPVGEAIERLREKLIDLTANNRLLNFKHGAGVSGSQSVLRFVDEVPDPLWGRLMDGKTLVVDAVPEPTAGELEAYYREHGAVPGLEGEEARNVVRPKDPAIWARWLDRQGERHLNYELPLDADVSARPARFNDNRIATMLYADQLDTRLRRLRSNARTAVQESGSNLLFLAFGFLEWKEKPAPGHPVDEAPSYLAPLLLVPAAIEPEVTSRGRRYTLAWTGEEVQTNLSLERKLAQDFAIPLPKLSDMAEDEGPEGYFDRVAKLVARQPGWKVRRFVTLALLTNVGKLLLYLDLDPKNWPDKLRPAGHPLVKEVLGAGQERFPLPEAEPAEQAKAFDLNLALVDKADPSQGRALTAALTGRSLVIQGPPGTGKSQTITNLIAAALDQGRTVLFVAEKLAALEVVRRRLREAGLGDFCLELHSHKTRKKAFYEDIAARLSRTQRGEPPAFDRALKELADRRFSLDEYARTVGEPAGSTGFTVSALLFEAGRLRLEAPDLAKAVDVLDLDDAVAAARDPLEAEAADREGVVASLEAAAVAADALDAHGGIASVPWRGVASDSAAAYDEKTANRALTAWRDTAQTVARLARTVQLNSDGSAADVAAARRVLDIPADLVDLRRRAAGAQRELDQLKTALRLPLGDGPAALPLALKAIELAASAPTNWLPLNHEGLDAPGADAALDRLAEHVAARARLVEGLQGKVERPEQEGREAEPLRRAGRTLADAGFFDRFGGRWRSARALAREHAAPGASKKAKEQARALLDLAEVARRDSDIRDDEAIRTVAGPHLRGAATDIEGLRAVHGWRREVERAFAGLNERPVRRAMLEAQAEDLADIAAFLDGDLHTAAKASAGLPLGASRETDLWRALAETIADPPWREPLVLAASPDAVGGLLTGLKSLVDANAEMVAAETYAVETLKLDLEDWFGGPRTELGPVAVGRRAEEALHAQAALQPWLAYDRARAKVKGWGAEAVLARLESGGVARREAGLAWRLAWASAAAKAVLKARPVLLEQDGATLKNLRSGYARLDEEVMMLRRRRIAARLMERRPPKGAQSTRVKEKTELTLLEHAVGLERRHPAVREVMARAGHALQAIKPCFMMGPLSVAQFLEPGKLQFDLVVMDEASQMRPEDAVGAVARGGQLVVVGDDQQLPPTSFFDRVGGDAEEVEDEGQTAGQTEPSILSLAAGSFGRQGSPMLQWHYRSRHPELIAFSNAWFYKGELVVFPAPTEADAELGLELVPVPDGAAEQGVNDVEARRIAEAAVAHLSAHPGRSLGVVAMNIRQAERIDGYVNELRKSNPEAAAALDRGEDDVNRIEPFFIKNLENVQGDERDVMMVSMTYGPREAGGKVPQNFGPINRDGGHRRLNVLFSRAKERMVIFSSMRSTDITPGEAAPDGVRALRDFLQYAETKRLPSGERITGKAPESPFEMAVAAALERAGYSVEPQLGVESFRIDLAVRDPDRPKAFLLGIECDGASYHSSLSARDRDRLRQEILERLGWEIERVWSVDWYRDPQGQVDRILKRLESLRTPDRSTAPVVENALPDAVAAKLNGGSAPAPGRTGAVTREEAREALVALREKIERDFPDTDPAAAFLRPRLLDELLRKKPADLQQWGEVIPEELRSATNRDEFRAYREEVFGILAATG